MPKLSDNRLSLLSIWTLTTAVFLIAINVNLGQSKAMKLTFPPDRIQFNSSDELQNPPNRVRSPFVNCSRGMLYHNETQKCWPKEKQGPCPKNMILYQVHGRYGDCDCLEVHLTTVWLYDVASNRCFRTFEQAFCANGKWLTLSKDGNVPVCSRNPCEALQRENPEENEIHPIVLVNNKCVRVLKVGENAGCPNPDDQVVVNSSGLPICSSELEQIADRNIGGVKPLSCRPGTRRDRLGKCRPVNTK